ncbi:response regulator, partial [Dokdonella sp.]|uniref:response regulator n=1 Tax=Dokdonella sp. TaxID=2291710 RepID=UPI003C3D0475
LTVLGRMLEKAGHRVLEVNSGEEVLDAMEREHFDLAIVDLHMPGLSGIDTIKQARVMQVSGDRTPFLVLSADATSETMRAAERAGARAFLTKPVSITKLLDTLSEVSSGPSQAMVKSKDAEDRVSDDVVISRKVLDELQELQLGDQFLQVFVDECVRDSVRCIAEIEKLANAEQWDLFRDQCHALKGVAENMGAVQLAESASESMRLGNWELAKDWRLSVEDLSIQLDRVQSALKTFWGRRVKEGEPERQ